MKHKLRKSKKASKSSKRFSDVNSGKMKLSKVAHIVDKNSRTMMKLMHLIVSRI